MANATSSAPTAPASKQPNNHAENNALPLSNGDVEMESDEDDDDGPLEPLPLPKVGLFNYL